MSFTIKIRAHHLLCFQGYQGYGYNDDFKANLEQIIKLINTTTGLVIEVIAENDVICRCCPYTGEAGCMKDTYSAPKIWSMDLKILEKLNLKTGTKMKAHDLITLTNTMFKTCLDVQGICTHCHWNEKCLWFQKLAPHREACLN